LADVLLAVGEEEPVLTVLKAAGVSELAL